MARTPTSGVRINTPLYKRMQAIQKQVEAAGSRKPTFTGIIQAWEAYTDPQIVLDELIEKWKEPAREELRQGFDRRRKAKRKT